MYDFPLNWCGSTRPHGAHQWEDHTRTESCPGRPAEHEPADPPADWLMAWASGWLAGYATGYDHGHADGEQEYGASLAEALTPMRRAAAHGIDVQMARAAWESQRRREHAEGGGS